MQGILQKHDYKLLAINVMPDHLHIRMSFAYNIIFLNTCFKRAY